MSEVIKNIEPLDGHVLLQLQYVPKSMKSGIILATTARETEQYSRKFSRIVKAGENAFYTRTTGQKFANVNVGDFVIAPNIAGRIIKLKHPSDPQLAVSFVLTDDVHIEIKIYDPIAYLDSLEDQTR
jgi:co-chaperonin GroES (HSP10)